MKSTFASGRMLRWQGACWSMVAASCVVALSLSVGLAGCGAGGEENAPALSGQMAASDAAAPPGAPAANEAAKSAAAGGGASPPPTSTAQLVQTAAVVPRKIIYNATVDLISDNFTNSQQNLLSLVKKYKGYVAETNVTGTSGAPRQGSWKIRVPVEQFDAFMSAVVKFGELQTTHTDSQDVTAQYYDLQARISNKQVEEKRLISHLQRSTAKLSDILEVEKELSRVRGEIEEMQGQVRLLANLSALTTITVAIREVKGYVPPKPTTFTTQIARTFNESFDQLKNFGKGIVLVCVALVPWLIILAIVGIPIWKIARRQRHM